LLELVQKKWYLLASNKSNIKMPSSGKVYASPGNKEKGRKPFCVIKKARG